MVVVSPSSFVSRKEREGRKGYKGLSFPRSAWERPQDKLSFLKKLSLLLKYGRGASGLHQCH